MKIYLGIDASFSFCRSKARGTALTQSLDGEPHLAALLQRLLEDPTPSQWQSLSLQELVRFLEKGPVEERPDTERA